MNFKELHDLYKNLLSTPYLNQVGVEQGFLTEGAEGLKNLHSCVYFLCCFVTQSKEIFSCQDGKDFQFTVNAKVDVDSESCMNASALCALHDQLIHLMQIL